MKHCGLTWNNITKRAADRQQWRPLGDALCTDGREEDYGSISKWNSGREKEGRNCTRSKEYSLSM